MSAAGDLRKSLQSRVGEIRAELETLDKEAIALDSEIAARLHGHFVPPTTAGTVADIITHALSEYERFGIDGVVREILTETVLFFDSEIRRNTIRVTVGRMLKEGSLVSFGSLTRLPPWGTMFKRSGRNL